MTRKLGYTQPLFILAFDHRGSLMKKMFDIVGRPPTAEETTLIASYKQIIYQGFQAAVKNAVPAKAAALLTDEQFGDAILQDAVKHYTVCLAVEKSGQEEFDFEYGDQFGEHINKYKPTIVKVLIRYNPEDDAELNQRQVKRLKQLTDFCRQNNYPFLIEALVPATESQLARVGGDKARYDNELRADLMVAMVAELQAAGVEPDIWKIEGLEKSTDYKKIVEQMRGDGRGQVAAVVLGRGADGKQVEQWLKAGKNVDGIIGFAIGRTIFWDPLVEYKEQKINATEAAKKISTQYQHFYQIFSK